MRRGRNRRFQARTRRTLRGRLLPDRACGERRHRGRKTDDGHGPRRGLRRNAARKHALYQPGRRPARAPSGGERTAHRGRLAVVVVPAHLHLGPGGLGASGASGIPAGELPRHEQHGLRRRHSDGFALAARRRRERRTDRTLSAYGLHARRLEPQQRRGDDVPRARIRRGTALRPGRHAGGLRQLRGRAAGRFLRSAAQLFDLHAAPPRHPHGRFRTRGLRAGLVRLGIRTAVHRRRGDRNAAQSGRTGLQVGGRGRRLPEAAATCAV